MNCLVVYDVPKTKIRARVADVCLDYGLTRIQFSAFFGELSVARQAALLAKIKRKVGKNDGNVQVIPVCERCMAGRQELCVNGYRLGQSARKRQPAPQA